MLSLILVVNVVAYRSFLAPAVEPAEHSLAQKGPDCACVGKEQGPDCACVGKEESKPEEHSLAQNATAEAPAAAAAPLVAAPSAADVYAHVNMVLNRMQQQARERVAAAEEQDRLEADRAQSEEATEEKADEQVEKAEEAVEADDVVNATDAAPNATDAAPNATAAANATDASVAPAPEPECDCTGKPDCGCDGRKQSLVNTTVPKAEEAPKVEEAKAEAPKVEEAKAEAPKVEAPKVEEAPKPAPQPVSIEEQRERQFPTDWIKHDKSFNVDKDVMRAREDSVEAAVREQQQWNSKTKGVSSSWLQTFRLKPWGK